MPETVTTGLVELGERYRRARADLDEAIRAAIAAGMSEVEAARLSGFSRPTVRKLLGK